LHWATVLFVLAQFASAWLHTLAEVRQSDFTPFCSRFTGQLVVTIWVVTALRLLGGDQGKVAAVPDRT